MKLKQHYLVALASLFVLSSQASAQITTAEAQPETDILLPANPGGVSATLIDGTGNPGVRGETFQLGEVGESFALSGFTLEANMAATFVDGNTFTIALYTGDPSGNFAPTTSPGTPENVTPEFLDANSGLTLIYVAWFRLNDTAIPEHVRDAPVAVSYTHLTLPTICSV